MAGEHRGVPSVGIMTTPFVDGARMMADALGLPGYRFAVVDHPISSADDEGLAARAVAVIEQSWSLLVRPEGD